MTDESWETIAMKMKVFVAVCEGIEPVQVGPYVLALRDNPTLCLDQNTGPIRVSLSLPGMPDDLHFRSHSNTHSHPAFRFSYRLSFSIL